jgi:hypothetical protein
MTRPFKGTEEEQPSITASAREIHNLVYERQVLEPVISTRDRNVSNDFSNT